MTILKCWTRARHKSRSVRREDAINTQTLGRTYLFNQRWDYNLQLQIMSLRLGSTAPDFEAQTTAGPIKFHDWIGDSWVCHIGLIPRYTTEFDPGDPILAPR